MSIAAFKASGIGVAPYTPYKPDREINYEMFDKMVDYWKAHNVEHLYVNGTMAEGLCLTVEERKKTCAEWIRAAKGKISPLIIHVGTGNLKESKELAAHAQSIGADAIACVAPTYYKPPTVEILVDYMAEVAAGAPKLPFYYYDIAFITGCKVGVADFFEKGEKKIPTLRGAKFSSIDFYGLQDAVNACGKKFQILPGPLDWYLPSLSIGVDCPVTSPVMGPIFHKMEVAFKAGDMKAANVQQAQAMKMAKIGVKYGGSFGIHKAIFCIMSGLDIGNARLPIANPTAAEKESIKKDLKEAGILD